MRLGIMCSGNGTNFENIVTNPICKEHEVVLMIHNTKQCGAVKRAAKWGIPHVRIPHKDEERMIEMFKVWRVDLIILAGLDRKQVARLCEEFKIERSKETLQSEYPPL